MKLWFKKGAWASRRGREKAAAIDPEAVRSVAVIRHAAVGDMIHVRPFIQEVRRHFPKASITLSLASNYMRGAPTDLVDRVHVVIGSDNRSATLREKLASARELGEHDIIFDLAATSRSYWVCLLNKARLKVGFPYKTVQRLLYDVAVLRSDFQFEADVMLDMLHVFGFRTRFPLDYALAIEPAQRERPYVVYFPSASTPDKCWPHDRFAELVVKMADRFPDEDHIVLEGIAEWESIDGLMAQVGSRANAQSIACDSFDDTMSLLQGAAMVVSNDTGIRNLAIATDTPTVGIFFATEPYRYWPRTGRHDAVFVPDGSLPPVDDVFDAASGLLAKWQSS